MAFFRPEYYPEDPNAPNDPGAAAATRAARPADGWRMPAPPLIGTDTDNDRCRQQQFVAYGRERELDALRVAQSKLPAESLGTDTLRQGQSQRPATAEDYGPLHGERPVRLSRAVIKARIARLRREANNLEALLRSIPENLPPDADEALWGLLTKS